MKLIEIIESSPKSYPTYIYVVAEIGINHNGDMGIAKQLISNAADAGCDAVKFQKRDINLVYGKEFLESSRISPWGTTQRDQKIGLEFSKDQYLELKDFSHENGLDFSASAWDFNSLEFLLDLNLDFQKVASAFAVHEKFLKTLAEKKLPTILSLGMCSQIEADKAIKIFEDEGCPYIPMHCVSTYPTAEEDLNLSQIPMMRKRYNKNIGYSGHESSVSPSIVAAALGARVIERHITLDRAMYGSDQSASLEQRGLVELVSILRKLPNFFGNESKSVSNEEELIAKKLRYWLS